MAIVGFMAILITVVAAHFFTGKFWSIPDAGKLPGGLPGAMVSACGGGGQALIDRPDEDEFSPGIAGR
jgi:hypothetical protein